MAFKLKSVDDDYLMHRQAYLYMLANAKKSAGKREVPVYRTFDSFYNYHDALKQVEEKEKKTDGQFLAVSKFLKEQKENKEVSNG